MTKIGVIGAGHLGKFHINNLKNLETVDLIGFFDIDSKRSQQISEQYDVDSFDNIEKLLKNCEAVSIVTPTITHYEIAKTALLHGLHIFCEKPFMHTLSQADEILKLAKEKNRFIQVGHIERFNPALESIEHLILKPLFIECHRISPFNPRGIDVSIILDLMIHDLDIILTLVDSPIESIDTSGTPVLTDTIDIANVRIKFKNGCVANITASRVSDKQIRKIRIFQKDTYVNIDFLKKETEIFSIKNNPNIFKNEPKSIASLHIGETQEKNIYYSKNESKNTNAMLEELRSFANSIATKTEPSVNGRDGLKALQLALQIEEQIKQNLMKI